LTAGDYELALASYPKAGGDRDREIRWAREGREAQKNPPTLTVDALRRYAGDYGPRHVRLEGDTLVYSRDGRPKTYKLRPMGGDTFLFEGMGTFRVRFVLDAEGRVTKLVGVYADGSEDESPRDR
jgi:hypothetical protein